MKYTGWCQNDLIIQGYSCRSSVGQKFPTQTSVVPSATSWDAGREANITHPRRFLHVYMITQ